MYDLIGDIHGHADELVALLEFLGYERNGGVYGHRERRLIFLGDFIDRGPQIRDVLEIVRPMVEKGKALSVMGNHELNALAYHTADPERPSEYLRRHTDKNKSQHHRTIEQLEASELKSYLDWFRTLPLWFDLENGPRVVHACWDGEAMKAIEAELGPERTITNDDHLRSACKKGNALFVPVEIILKGKEVALPEGCFFHDKDECKRTSIRTRWYLSPEGQTFGDYAIQSDPIEGDVTRIGLTDSVKQAAAPYPATAKPVFIGHYWLSALRPKVLAENVACLDYSVAKRGFLCAYRWQGEQKLNDDHFVRVADTRRIHA